MKRNSPVTFAILAVIIVVYMFEVLAGGSSSVQVLVDLGAIVPGLLSRGEWWRLVAAMFLHIGILHLFLNLWALYQLGGVFEMLFGSRRFAVTYFVSGIVASLTSAIFIASNGVAAGASGAIFGVLGALIVSIRRSPRFRHAAWTRGLLQQLILWAGINIIIGFMPGIDNAAHIGGFACGLLLGLAPHRIPPPPPSEVLVESSAYEPPRREAP
ncbi:MAG TPA: rhomboid family intramembrane serine protease [Thermoanaerobaculia bacterium]|nr:rhomboid family intramembrane serine protease [Thermoanaerobaculia bacterium]